MSKLANHLIHAPSFTARPRVGVGFECVCQKPNEKVVNEFDFLPNELYKLFYKRSNNMQNQETDILSARESRIAVALFEIMKPQIVNLHQALISMITLVKSKTS